MGNLHRSMGPGRAALLLGIFLGAAFFPILVGGQTFFYRDFGVMGYPTMAYYQDCLWRGEFPLWNPYSNCGVPFLAQWGTMVLYPGSLIYLLFPIPWSINFFCLVHLFLGGMGMYFLLRHYINDDSISLLGCCGYVFSGITLGSLTWPNYTVALGWMPWVVWLTGRAGLESGKWTVLAAISGALQLLSGVPEITIMTWTSATILLLAQVSASRVSVPRALSRFILAGILMLGLCLAQLLPFFELLQNSQRATGGMAEKWPLPGWGWANFIFPMFRVVPTPEGTWFQYDQYFLSSSYLGTGVVAMAVIGALFSRDRRAMAAALIALMSLILALGSNGYLYSGLRGIFPMLSIARYPIKFVFFLALVVPLLMAFGISALQKHDVRRDRILTGSWCFLIAAAAFLLWEAKSAPFPYDQWPVFFSNSIFRLLFATACLVMVRQFLAPSDRIDKSLWVTGLSALIVMDAMTHIPRQNPTVDSMVFTQPLASTNLSWPTHGEGRVFISPEAEKTFLYSQVRQPQLDLLGKRAGFWSHLNLLERIPKVNGSATLQLKNQKRFQDLLYASPAIPEKLLGMLNVTLISSPQSPIEWIVVSNSLPFLTGGQMVQRLTDDEAAEALFDNFDPAKSILLPEGTPISLDLRVAEVEIKHLKIGLQEITCEVTSSANSMLFISQSWHPAWKAQVDQNPQPVYRANLAFQAIEIPAGTSKVRIFYDDKNFYWGVFFSALTLLGCGVYLVLRIGKIPRINKVRQT